jgi:hypothetical protein
MTGYGVLKFHSIITIIEELEQYLRLLHNKRKGKSGAEFSIGNKG